MNMNMNMIMIMIMNMNMIFKKYNIFPRPPIILSPA